MNEVKSRNINQHWNAGMIYHCIALKMLMFSCRFRSSFQWVGRKHKIGEFVCEFLACVKYCHFQYYWIEISTTRVLVSWLSAPKQTHLRPETRKCVWTFMRHIGPHYYYDATMYAMVLSRTSSAPLPCKWRWCERDKSIWYIAFAINTNDVSSPEFVCIR